MILVTGATGNIGPNVVRSLLASGIAVRAGIHVQPLDVDGIETCTIDFDVPETNRRVAIVDLMMRGLVSKHSQDIEIADHPASNPMLTQGIDLLRQWFPRLLRR